MVRQLALVQSQDEHNRELQPLGGMQGEQGRGVHRLGQGVLIGDQGDLLGMGLRAQASYARQTRWESPAPQPIGPRFSMGMRVRHPSFGEGVVMETMLHSDDEEVTVEFERGGVKRLSASVAPLEILE